LPVTHFLLLPAIPVTLGFFCHRHSSSRLQLFIDEKCTI